MIIDDTATALYTILKAGTALTALLPGTTSIYHMQAPDDATYPFVVYSHQAGGPEGINPSKLESNIWWVRVHSVTSALSAGQIFAQADLLLDRVNLSITGATTIWCQREENIALIETAQSGVKYYTCGGMYRIRTTNT